MSRCIGRIYKLTRNEAVRNGFCKLLGSTNGTLHTQRSRSQFQFGTESLEEVSSFNTHGIRHGNNDPVSAGGGNHGKTDTGISGGRFDNYRISGESAAFFRILNHFKSNAILDGTGRIEELQLCNDFSFKLSAAHEFIQFKQRGMTDQIEDRIVNFGHQCLLIFLS